MRSVKKFLSAAALGIGLSALATSVHAGLNSAPAVVQFPDTNFGGATTTATVTVVNDGTGLDHLVNNVAITADITGSFSISNDTCTGVTLLSNPAGVCTFDVTFDPAVCTQPGLNMGAIAEVTFDADLFLDVGLQGEVLCDDGQPDPTPQVPGANGACDVIQFSQPFYSFHEGDALARVWVTRTGCGDGVATADYTVGSQTAVLDTDFALVGPLPQTVTFNDGEFIPQPVTFNISGNFDDLLEEFNEEFSVILSNPRLDGQIDPTRIVLGLRSTAEAEIVDNDVPGVVQFSQPEYYFQEGNLMAEIVVTRTGGTSGVVGGTIFVNPQTATNADFTQPLNPITFTFNDNDDTPKVFTFGMTADSLMEGDETFSLVIGNTQGNTSIGTNGTATVHIVDDDHNGVIQFGQVEYYFDEGNMNAQVAVTRIGGSSGPVSATISINNGTTEGAADFTAPAAADLVVDFADGNTDTQYVTFPILTDNLQEGDEYFVLTLGSPTGGASIGANQSADVHIVDDDVAGVIQFSEPVYYFNEGNMMASVLVTRTGGNSGDVSATVTVNPQTATLNADFIPPGVLTVNFGNGISAPQLLTFQIVQDAIQEGDEFFQLALGSPTNGASIGTQATTTVHIVDDDTAGVLQFSEPHYFYNEGTLNAQVWVTRTGGNNNLVGATVTVNQQTASQNLDFTVPVQLTVQFPDGDAAPRSLTFPILADNLQEGEETFNLILGNPTGGASIGTQSNTTVHIIDDDVAGTIQFSAPQYFFHEGNMQAQVLVTRTGGSSNTVSATVTVNAQTATLNDDFVPPGLLTVTFGNGVTTPQILTFQIPEDTLQEGDEFFQLVLANPTNGASLGAQSITTVHIIDDDVPGSVQFSQPEYFFVEGNLMANVLVTRTGGSSGDVSALVTVNPQTATLNADFVPPQNLLVEFADGVAAPFTLTFQIPQDVIQEGGEFFQLVLGSPTGGVTIGNPNPTTVHIIDDDVAGVLQFSEPDYYFVEGNLMAQVFVTRVGGSSGPVGATVTVSPGTATEGADFTSPPAPITVDFNDGETAPQAVVFQIEQDTLQEGEEFFTLILSNPTGGASLGNPWTALVHIIDDDTAGVIRFSAATYTFKETVGSAIVFVNREGGNSGPVSVHYATSNGTATSPEDYSNVEGVLTWVDGDNLPKPIVIPVYTDSEDAERRLSVILDGVTGEGVLGDPSVAEVIILDAGVDGVQAGPNIEGGPSGGCSLAHGKGNALGSATPWVVLMAAFLAYALRRGRAAKATVAVLALGGSLVLQGCGDDPARVRKEATEEDYQVTIRVLADIVSAFSTTFNGVDNCGSLNGLSDNITADPVLYCDSGYIHVIPEVQACTDSSGLDADFMLSIVPEECIFQPAGAEVDGDFNINFEPLHATAPYEAELTTNGITVNDIEYIFHELKISVDQNGNVTCYGGLSDGVSSCYIAADCSGCENLN